MTSATLFREGTELDALLAELDAEHPGRVSVVDVEYGRAGGVLGFFAHRRVGVHYRLTDEKATPAATAAVTPVVAPAAAATPRPATPEPGSPDPASFDDLLAAADAAD